MCSHRVWWLVLVLTSSLGCSLQGQTSGVPHASGSPTIADSGPTQFSSQKYAEGLGAIAAAPDDADVASGYEKQGGPQMHLRISRAYCDKRSSSQQSAADQANFFCVPDAVTVDDAHPPSSMPNKDFLIVPYKYGMNMEYPGPIEVNSIFFGIHPYSYQRCNPAETDWIAQDSCHAGGQLWMEDNEDYGGLFATSYAITNAGVLDRAKSFTLLASDTYGHRSHGDMLLAVRDSADNFRFQFGQTGVGGADDPDAYKNYTRARIDSTGKAFFDGGTQVGGADFAESVTVSGQKADYGFGDVLVIDSSSDRAFSRSSTPYSTLVAGVFSTKPGVLGSLHHSEDASLSSEIAMAMVGIVPCKVTTENGAIARGDLLVTSTVPGYAMRGTDNARLPGAILGKALQPLSSGFGTIEVLLTLK
jgi:hypothetical protein